MNIAQRMEAVNARHERAVLASRRLLNAVEHQRREMAAFRQELYRLQSAVGHVKTSLVAYDGTLGALQGNVGRLGDTQRELVGIMDRSLNASQTTRFKAAA
jgi:hypothetical protein